MHSVCAFGSDNFSPAHPSVLDALKEANQGYASAYGADPWTQKAHSLFKKNFGPNAETFMVHTGTAANACIIKHTLSSWQAVLCPENAHIWNDECGAPTGISGCTMLPLPIKEGKLDINALPTYLPYLNSHHRVQPAAIFITQPTELGTLYTLDELASIRQFAQKHKLLFLMDGARLCNAAAALNLSLRELTTDVGVDILSFGGTKNGLLGAEAVVFLKPELSKNFQYVRKQQLQLASKMRFLAAQFIALFEHDLWLKNARQANAMAKYFKQTLIRSSLDFSLYVPVDTNSLFATVDPDLLKPLYQNKFGLIWDEKKSLMRWVASWNTQPELVETFLADLKDFVKAHSS